MVAIPDMWDKKFSATLSPVNMCFILPFTMAIVSPLLTLDPSFFFKLILIFLSINLNVCLTNYNPPIIPD